MRIDLHTHSTASDGTSSPAEVIAAAANADLDVVGLTDHDTTAGWAPATAALATVDRAITLIPGVELSCSVTTGRGPISLHLLAYLFDPAEPRFAEARRRLREARTERAAAMVAGLQADGHPVTVEQVAAIAAGSPIGRPHVAQALVESGVVRAISARPSPRSGSGRPAATGCPGTNCPPRRRSDWSARPAESACSPIPTRPGVARW